jgi:hypothetical protein
VRLDIGRRPSSQRSHILGNEFQKLGRFLDRLGKGMSLTERSQKGSSLISASRRILGLLERVLVGGFFSKMCNSVAFALHIFFQSGCNGSQPFLGNEPDTSVL